MGQFGIDFFPSKIDTYYIKGYIVNIDIKVVRTGPDQSNREPDLHPVRVSHKTGLHMNRSLNRKIGRKQKKNGGSKNEPV
jgi:hypothetical protein